MGVILFIMCLFIYIPIFHIILCYNLRLNIFFFFPFPFPFFYLRSKVCMYVLCVDSR